MPEEKIVVTVIGAGKIGLPLACQFAAHGAQVIACDVRKDVVKSINRGRSPIEEPGIAEVLKKAVEAGNLSATSDTPKAVSESNVVVVVVPIPLTATNEADVSVIEEVTAAIAKGLKSGTLVSYETTLPVGTTRNLARILETTGLVAGQDFDLAFSPERVKSNMVMQRLAEHPKVVGGINERSADRAEEFYAKYLGAPVINVDSLEAAEFVKLAGVAFRDVNIALSNELARYADAIGVDAELVIKAANTDGEAALLRPGIGVGGYRAPVYPHFLINDADNRGIPCELPAISRAINDTQPNYFLDRVEETWKSLAGQSVLMLGLGFRPQVKDSSNSPAYKLRDELKRRGAQPYIQDGLYTDDELRALGFETWESSSLPPVVILVTAHEEFKQMKPAKLAARGCEVLVDGRNAFSHSDASKSGIIYIGVGRSYGLNNGNHNNRPIPLTRPLVASRESAAAASVIRSGSLVQGPQVARLEKEFGEYVGAGYTCAVSSGTAALHLALLACGIGPGDEVITVSHAFIAPTNAIRYCGAIPVFVDVEPDTFNINTDQIEEAISEKTKAILCVHQMGMPCDLTRLLAIARRNKLRVIEGAAGAVGSEILLYRQWQRIGRPHGDVACFSFHPRNLVTTGDGGMITTENGEIDRLCRLWRDHGTNSLGMHDSMGFNYRLTDIQAAIGHVQMQRLPAQVARRRQQAGRYHELLRCIEGVNLPREPEWARSNWQSYCVTFGSRPLRDAVAAHLTDLKIESRPGIACSHLAPAYTQELWRCAGETLESSAAAASKRLKHSEQSQERGLLLPLFDNLSEAEMQRVAEAIASVVSKHALAKL